MPEHVSSTTFSLRLHADVVLRCLNPYQSGKMLSSVLSNSVPSLRRTISDYGLRSKSKRTDMVVHRRSESTEMILSTGSADVSPELKNKLSLHGFGLLQTSLAEASGNNPNSRAFSRQLYLDSVAYLLQALPSDLNQQEASQLVKSMPNSVQSFAPLPPLSSAPCAIEYAKPIKPPSMLHRSLSSAIILFCFFIRLFLPYIKCLVAVAYRYERTHHVSERLFATTMSATDTVGRRAIDVASSALGSQVVIESVAYCVDGVCGGLTEGLGEGIKAMELDKMN